MQEAIADESPLHALVRGAERARKLTVWTVLALAIGTGVSWSYADRLYGFLAGPSRTHWPSAEWIPGSSSPA